LLSGISPVTADQDVHLKYSVNESNIHTNKPTCNPAQTEIDANGIEFIYF
jgi:hypothetical protein